MNILVLGSEGQIGKPFCKLADEKGHRLFKMDKKNGINQNLSFDLCVNELEHYMLCSDVIVFLAFEVGGSKYLEATDSTIDYISENARLLDNVFTSAQKFNKPLLFTSSQMSNMTHTNYGLLKLLGERYAKALGKHICRFWNVYGYESPDDPKSHVITDFINMAKQGHIKMRTTGEEERQFLHADDCSRALLHWCENSSLYNIDKYIDITSFEWTSINNIASIIQSLIPCSITIGSKKDSLQIGIKNPPNDYILNFWKPEISLEQGIKKLI